MQQSTHSFYYLRPTNHILMCNVGMSVIDSIAIISVINIADTDHKKIEDLLPHLF